MTPPEYNYIGVHLNVLLCKSWPWTVWCEVWNRDIDDADQEEEKKGEKGRRMIEEKYHDDK